MLNEPVRGKDTSVLELTRVRLNGMVRKDRVWQPIDCLPLSNLEELENTIAARQRVGTRHPGSINYETRRYRNLPDYVQSSIDHYLSVHGVIVPRPEMEVVFGSSYSQDFKHYMAEIAMREGYDSWEEYHAWYRLNVLSKDVGRGVPSGARDVWPVILSDFADEGIQDGSHRLHQYMMWGHEVIPWIAFPDELAQIKRIVASWKLRAERVQAHLLTHV